MGFKVFTSSPRGLRFLRRLRPGRGSPALLCLAILFAIPAQASPSGKAPLTQVSVQLKWYHQFQFAGFYAAEQQGYFADAGLDVTLLEGSSTIDPAAAVAEGRADFGVGNSSLLIDHQKGPPLAVLAAFFQHSPFVILAHEEPGIQSVTDLEGRVLMAEPHAAELIAYLKLAGVDLDKVTMVPHTGRIESLAPGDPQGIAATTAYMSTEPFLALQAGVPYQLFNPRDEGIDFYGDTLFTTRAYANDHPAVTIAMRDALRRGWRYALAHPDDITTLIMERYHPRMDRLTLGVEAQVVASLMLGEIVDIGYMSRERWRHIAETFERAGLLEDSVDLDGFLFETDRELPSWIRGTLLFGAILLTVVIAAAIMIARANRRLNQGLLALAEQGRALRHANAELERLSTTDSLTGLANRRALDDALESARARAVQEGSPLCLLMIDVDYFKHYNDIHGHQQGDACLKLLAETLEETTRRAGCLAARYGGEEFVIVAPGLDGTAGIALAEALRLQVAALALPHDAAPKSVVTISAGVACLSPTSPLTANQLFARADSALYRAKESGRNRVEAAEDS